MGCCPSRIPFSHRGRCPGSLVISALLLYAGLAVGCFGFTAAAQVRVSHRAQQRHYLKLGETVAREIGLGEVHTYQVTLTAGQFLRTVVKERRGVNVVLTLLGPSRRKLIAFGANSDRIQRPLSVPSALKTESLSYVAEGGETYQLEVRALNETPPGSYELTIEEIRPATAQDRQRQIALKAFAEGEELRSHIRDATALRNARKKYEEALAHWRELGDASGEAHTLNSIGIVVYDNVSSFDKKKAVDSFNQALELWRAAGNLQGEANALTNLCFVDNEEPARADLRHRALRAWQAVGDRRWEAIILHYLTGIYRDSADTSKELDYFERSLEVWETADDQTYKSETLFYFAQFHNWTGDPQKAREVYKRTLKYSQAIKFLESIVATLLRIGEIYLEEGEYQQALNYYDQALALCRNSGQRAEAYALYNLGTTYLAFGEKQKALDYLTRSLAQWGDNLNGEAYTLEKIGKVYDAAGEKQKALDYYLRALPPMRATGDRHGEAIILNDIGNIHLARGNGKPALASYNQALNLSRAAGFRNVQAQSLINIGNAFDIIGDRQTALENYQQSLIICRAIAYPAGEAKALYHVAGVERALGRVDNARARLEEALRIVESLHRSIGGEELRSSFFASVQKYYEMYIDVLMALHRERPYAGYDGAAFQASERARARSLLDALGELRGNIRQGVDPALLERERLARQRLNAKAARQTRLVGGHHQPEETAALAQEIGALTNEYEQVQALIRTNSPRYDALTRPQPLSFQQIQAEVLDPDTLLLEYALGEKRSFLWAVTPTSVNSYELPKRAEIETIARRLYDLLTVRNRRASRESTQQWLARLAHAEAEYTEAAARLSQILLGPVAGLLKSNRIVVVSDGALQYLPFAALPDPVTLNDGGDRSQPLVVEHEIVNLPSASVLALVRRETASREPAPRAVAVVADPVFDQDDPRVKRAQAQTSRKKEQTLPADLERSVRSIGIGGVRGTLSRLPFTREEAETILAAVPAAEGMKAVDFEANLAVAKSPELAQYRIVHFATHGLLNTEHPMLSGVVLSLVNKRGQQQDGFLRMNEIYNLDLPVELVVLSACQTGLGKEVRGEGLLGLTRGFMYAGSKRVVTSLWKVNDEATSELMKRFYREMLVEGKTPAAALRASQVEMWHQKQWRSPYFWSAFVLQGEYR